MVAKKLVYYLIPLVVLILIGMWAWGPEALWAKTKGAYEGVKGFLPNVSVGAKGLEGGEPTIPGEQREAIDKLRATIKQMLKSNKTNCFASYGGLPELGEEGTSIIFNWREDKNLTELIVKGGAGGKQEVFYEEIKGMRPCVIAGKDSVGGDVSENFYYTFLEPDPSEVKSSTYYTPVGAINLFYYEGRTFFCRNANVIRVPEFGEDPVNDECDNLEDGGWLFTPDGKHICFFPTVYGDNDKDGTNNDFFELGEKFSVPNIVKINGLECDKKKGPAAKIIVHFAADDGEVVYEFIFDRVKKSWIFKEQGSSDWELVTAISYPEGGVPDYLLLAESLKKNGVSLNEEEGYEFFRTINHDDYNIEEIENIPGK